MPGEPERDGQERRDAGCDEEDRHGLSPLCLSLDDDLFDEPLEAQGDASDESHQGEVGGHVQDPVQIHAAVEAEEGHGHEHQAVAADPAEPVLHFAGDCLSVRAFHGLASLQGDDPFSLS